MNKLILCFISLFLMTSVTANTSEFINSINSHIQSGGSEPMQITFDDGYQMNIGAPIELVEGPRVRCPCTIYTLRYTNTETGAREERQIEDGIGGVKWKNGAESFFVTSANVVETDSQPPEARPTCEARGEWERIYIHPRKIIANNGRDCPINGTISCLGETITKCQVRVKCNQDPEYGDAEGTAYCMAGSDGQCPTDIKACIADTSLDDTLETINSYGMDLNETQNRVISQ